MQIRLSSSGPGSQESQEIPEPLSFAFSRLSQSYPVSRQGRGETGIRVTESDGRDGSRKSKDWIAGSSLGSGMSGLEGELASPTYAGGPRDQDCRYAELPRVYREGGTGRLGYHGCTGRTREARLPSYYPGRTREARLPSYYPGCNREARLPSYYPRYNQGG